MGLPDDYQLPGNTNEAYGLTGDGVVVPQSDSSRSTSSSRTLGQLQPPTRESKALSPSERIEGGERCWIIKSQCSARTTSAALS